MRGVHQLSSRDQVGCKQCSVAVEKDPGEIECSNLNLIIEKFSSMGFASMPLFHLDVLPPTAVALCYRLARDSFSFWTEAGALVDGDELGIAAFPSDRIQDPARAL